MYTLKSIARRGSMFGAAVALVAAAVVPSAAVFADALNPLTERSLLLSSSAPGYTDTDGSGNSASSPNAVDENYAPAGSGPNGTKTGETFSFKVSTDNSNAGNTVKAFTLQYCTKAAGKCQAPGDAGNMVPGYNPGTPSTAGDSRNGAYDEDDTPTGRPTNVQAHPNNLSDLDIHFADDEDEDGPGSGLVGGTDYIIRVNDTPLSTPSYADWQVATKNVEDSTYDGPLTGKQNFIAISTSGAGLDLNSQDKVEIIFKASEANYITNPGSGSFFVKINTYDTNEDDKWVDTVPTANPNIIDGGVTVANVMTDSIHITTKVLETMSFSVGTKNRDTVVLSGGQEHGTCDPIQVINGNRLNLGDVNAEYSLDTAKAYDVYSYWRLSSNSSGGATVYYSGNTLANTVGDEIADMPNEVVSQPGTEQFGLGFVDAGEDSFDPAFSNPDYDSEDPETGDPGLVQSNPTRYKTPRSFPFKTLASQTGAPYSTLAAQPASLAYDEAAGAINKVGEDDPTAKFKFVKTSLTVPEPIAQQNDQVISCATAKMRYVANIGADTPAGVYTTKVNYLAAPQY